MTSSSEMLVSSPTQDGTPDSTPTGEQPPKAREWGQFELDTMCSLICQHQHRPISWNVKRYNSRGARKFDDVDMDGHDSDNDYNPKDWALRLATKFNKALHGVHGYENDIPVENVRDLMDFVEEEYEFVVKFIERQTAPFRVTRTKKYVFERMYSDFNENFQAWTVRRWERRRKGIHDYIVVNTKEPPKKCTRSTHNTTRLVGNSRREKASTSLYARRGRETQKATPTPSPSPSPPPPPPPPQPCTSTSTSEQMRGQPYRHDTTIYDGVEMDMYSNPASSSYRNFSPVYETSPYFPPSAYGSPYVPPTPIFHGFAELRQSIHPTGPRPPSMTSISSIYPLPMHFVRGDGYLHRNTPRHVNPNDDVFLDTPTSPVTSPIYVPPSVRGSVVPSSVRGYEPINAPSNAPEQQYEQVQDRYRGDHSSQYQGQDREKGVQSPGTMKPAKQEGYTSGFRPGIDYSHLNY